MVTRSFWGGSVSAERVIQRKYSKSASIFNPRWSTYASSNRAAHGRLTKRGNKWLRWAFIEAVTPAVRSSAKQRAQYQRMKIRRGAKDARTAIARKLAELAWTIWTERRCTKGPEFACQIQIRNGNCRCRSIVMCP